MFKPTFEFVRQTLFLQRDVADSKDDVKNLEQRLDDTNETLRQFAHELQRSREHEQHEREKLMLRLDNALLRFERMLPLGRGKKRK